VNVIYYLCALYPGWLFSDRTVGKNILNILSMDLFTTRTCRTYILYIVYTFVVVFDVDIPCTRIGQWRQQGLKTLIVLFTRNIVIGPMPGWIKRTYIINNNILILKLQVTRFSNILRQYKNIIVSFYRIYNTQGLVRFKISWNIILYPWNILWILPKGNFIDSATKYCS